MKSIHSILLLTATFASTLAVAANTSDITLEQIMSDPDWIARSPESPIWSDDSSQIFYQQKQLGNPLKDTFVYQLEKGEATKLEENKYIELASMDGKLNADGSLKVFVHHNDVFTKDMTSGDIRQITKTHAKEQDAFFLNDGRIAYVVEQSFYAYDLANGLTEELVKLDTRKNGGNSKDESFLEQQQKRLFEIVRERERRSKLRAEQQNAIKDADDTNVAGTVYFDDSLSIDQVSLSPNGRWVFVSTSNKNMNAGKNDSMPTWVNSSGYVEPRTVRVHVGNADPFDQDFWLVDLQNGSKTELKTDKLERIKDDVLAKVKKENYKAEGKKYSSPKKSNREERAVYIYQWGGADGGIHWSDDGESIAVNLLADDNKDRWIVGVDFEDKKLTTYHHLQDEAWINKSDYLQFGFLPNSQDLYYISEESGYANLYLKKNKSRKATALAQGPYVVNNLTPSKDGQWLYFTANREHPGVYDVFRVNTQSKETQQLTQLSGKTDYVLSPDERKLALLHSSMLKPTELYLQDNAGDAAAKKLTNTITEKFSSKPWVKPDVIAVPSSHFKGGVYSRLYQPKADKKASVASGEGAPAVIFVHGAGYLQNAHKGWSGYFREFMFHTLLTQQGITVLDMDYRASKGYGRDHRTAIYRQMGTPELEDFKDGVDYLVKNHGIDRKRVGIYGGSYGGFMTFMALFKEPELFAAGAALRPVTDWAHYNHWYTAPILNTPEDDPIAYKRSSPIEFAEGLSKPLLICHGMLDDNVFFKDSVRLVQRLIELKKENFELAAYPIEPHSFKEPTSWLDEYRRIYKLFKQTIL